MRYSDPTLRKMLADEYVLGTLQGAPRKRFERLVREDVELREILSVSELRLNLLVETLPPVEPSSAVWQNVQRRIAPPQRTREYTSLWLDFRFWRGWAATASAFALALALYIGLVPLLQAPISYVVVITDDAQSQASWLVSTEAGSRQITINALNPQPLPADRAFQLWVKPADQEKVLPVGLIPASGRATLPVTAPIATKLKGARLFGVSIEPPGGSPTGQPTTTPLYHGEPLPL